MSRETNTELYSSYSATTAALSAAALLAEAHDRDNSAKPSVLRISADSKRRQQRQGRDPGNSPIRRPWAICVPGHGPQKTKAASPAGKVPELAALEWSGR